MQSVLALRGILMKAHFEMAANYIERANAGSAQAAALKNGLV
jgi:hypothetical protein